MNFIKNFVYKFFFLLNFGVALYALLVFQISYAADIMHWFGGFLMLSVPVAVVMNIFFMCVYIFAKSWRFLLSLGVLLTGYPLLARTVRFNFGTEDAFNGKKISLLSYNVMYGDYANLKKNKQAIENLVHDMDTLSADIKCFQEFYNLSDSPILNTIETLTKDNPYFTYMHSEIDKGRQDGAIGLAVFSKYPIIYKEEVSWKLNNNGMLLVDIVVDKDTIRVINIQTKSMGIRVEKVITANDEVLKKETKNILSQLKYGFVDRAIQVAELEETIAKSPYPILLAGDFNELPYGYAYGRVRKHLANAFEKSGNGFGFTYHKMPGFIRIDNIFYDRQHFESLEFTTFNELSNSDHLPIKATLGVRD